MTGEGAGRLAGAGFPGINIGNRYRMSSYKTRVALEALMNRLRFLALALVVGLVMAFPAAALGQAIPDHQSRLVVTINGEMAPDGTKVTPIMDGKDVATATTKDGIAFLKVPGTSANVGKEISFRVGDVMADETDTWEQGGHRDKKF